MIFRGIFKPSKQNAVEYIDADTHNQYMTKSKTIMLSTLNLYDIYIYRPIDSLIKNTSERIRAIQSGNIHLYLLYIFIMLIGVLVWVRYTLR